MRREGPRRCGGCSGSRVEARGWKILSRRGNFQVAWQRGWCLAGSPVGALGRGSKGAWTALSGRTAGRYPVSTASCSRLESSPSTSIVSHDGRREHLPSPTGQSHPHKQRHPNNMARLPRIITNKHASETPPSAPIPAKADPSYPHAGPTPPSSNPRPFDLGPRSLPCGDCPSASTEWDPRAGIDRGRARDDLSLFRLLARHSPGSSCYDDFQVRRCFASKGCA